jgi:hypothetical protein
MSIDAVVQFAGANFFITSENGFRFLGSGSLVNYAANCLPAWKMVEKILSNSKELFMNYQVIITKLFCIARFKF